MSWRVYAAAALLTVSPVLSAEDGAFSVLADPQSIEDMLALQHRLQEVLPRAMKSVVCLKSDSSSGTGVIVSEDGEIFTADHVVNTPGESPEKAKSASMKVVMPSGASHPMAPVSRDESNDAAIIRMTGAPSFKDYAPVAARAPAIGEWVFVLGHANGLNEERGPVVRLGRVIAVRNGYYKTDCKMIGGDSGGGLFNMNGELIGINSRVGADIEDNIHIPMPVFHLMKDKRKEPGL